MIKLSFSIVSSLVSGAGVSIYSLVVFCSVPALLVRRKSCDDLLCLSEMLYILWVFMASNAINNSLWVI